MKPTKRHKPDCIHLSSIHFGVDENNQPYIHLNNYNPSDSKFDSMRTDGQCKKQGINITLMIECRLPSLFKYGVYLTVKIIINKTDIITGIDLV